jgi:hypothetical protein
MWALDLCEIAAHQGCWELLRDEAYMLQIGRIRWQGSSAEMTSNLEQLSTNSEPFLKTLGLQTEFQKVPAGLGEVEK